MKHLNLGTYSDRGGEGLFIPVDGVTEAYAILGIRGSGKTNTAVVLAEELLAAEQQTVIIDPVDVWYGLKSSRDGKGKGYAIPIVGGDYADVPLESHTGAILADFIVDTGSSAVLSLSHLGENEKRRFATDFGEQLYLRKGPHKYRTPMMLILEEADELVPQRIPKGGWGPRMFGAYDRLVRRGRSRGIGVAMISQRPQVINKDVLSQAEVLIAHRIIEKRGRDALRDWTERHDTEGHATEFLESLPALKTGEAWVWSPSWLHLFARVKIRERQTFDSSRTPRAGEKRVEPKDRAPVDLDKLKAAIAETVERAEANDPDLLKRRIAELEQQVLAAGTLTAAGGDAEIEEARRQGRQETTRAHITDLAELGELHKGAVEIARRMIAHAEALQRDGLLLTSSMTSLLNRADRFRQEWQDRARVDGAIANHKIPPARERQAATAQRPVQKSLPPKPTWQANGSGKLPSGEEAVLAAIASFKNGVTRRQLTILCGYKKSSRDEYVRRL